MKNTSFPGEVQPEPHSRYRKLPLLGPNLDGLLGWLRQQGYAETTILNCLKASGPLCRWLQKRRGRVLSGLRQRDLRAAYDHFRSKRAAVAAAARLLGRFLVENRLIRAE